MQWILIVLALNANTLQPVSFAETRWDTSARCEEVGAIIKRDLESKLHYQGVNVFCQQQHENGESGHAVKEKQAACVMPQQSLIEQLKASLANPQSRRIFLQIASDDYDDNHDVEAFCRALDSVKDTVRREHTELAPS